MCGWLEANFLKCREITITIIIILSLMPLSLWTVFTIQHEYSYRTAYQGVFTGNSRAYIYFSHWFSPLAFKKTWTKPNSCRMNFSITIFDLTSFEVQNKIVYLTYCDRQNEACLKISEFNVYPWSDPLFFDAVTVNAAHDVMMGKCESGFVASWVLYWKYCVDLDTFY